MERLAATKKFQQQLVEWLKRSLEQNKEIYYIINEIKIEQEKHQKEIQEKIKDISDKLEQLIIPEDIYWKLNSC